MSFNESIAAEFRANGGHVAANGFGDRLVILHTRGARSGEPREHPLLALEDGDAGERIIAASAAGDVRDPAWAHNLRASAHARIEVPDGEGGIATREVVATELDGAEHDAGWAKFLAASPSFSSYEERAGRRIPVFRLVPAAR